MRRLLLLVIVTASFGRDYFTMSEQFYFERDDYAFQKEIKLGQGRVGKVNGNYWDVKIPLNRKSWALSLAHGHQLMRNILRTDNYPIDIFLATALKESDLGCDHNIIQEEGVEYPLGKQWDAGDGFYQIEGWGASAYGEMSKLYPKRFPEGEEHHGKLIGNDHFETATIGKVYYDLMVFHYWKYVNGYRPLELMDKSADRGAIIKILSAAFYMGHQTSGNFYKDIFLTNREDSYAEKQFLTFFDKEPYKSDNFYGMARDHAELVYQCAAIFQNNADAVSNPENNFFYDYYDSLISWNDFSEYIEKIKPLYPDVDWTTITTSVKTKFDAVKSGNPLSFRYEIAPVIDELIVLLPVENPVPNLKKQYSYAIAWHDSLEYEPDFNKDVSLSEKVTTANTSFTPKVTEDKVIVSLPKNQSVQIALYTLRGQQVKRYAIQNRESVEVSTAELGTGIYLLKVITANKNMVHPLIIR